MPRIIVVAECSVEPSYRVVMEERLVSAHLENDHASAQLVERLVWAVLDADELERTQPIEPHRLRIDGQDDGRSAAAA